MPLLFGTKEKDVTLEWKWYYDENYSLELDSIIWNRVPMPIFGTEKSTYENKSTTETINEFELYESEKIHENINQDIKIEKQALEELLKTPQKINEHQKIHL